MRTRIEDVLAIQSGASNLVLLELKGMMVVGDTYNQASAVALMERMGRTQESVDFLQHLLSNSEIPSTRGLAAEGLGRLGQIGNRQEIVPLLRDALQDPAPYVKIRAATSLLRIGEAELSQAKILFRTALSVEPLDDINDSTLQQSIDAASQTLRFPELGMTELGEYFLLQALNHPGELVDLCRIYRH